MDEGPLRILLAAPAYWPAHAFGGPVVAARELVRRLVERGHRVDVVTTTLEDVGRRPSSRTRVDVVDGATVTYLATPLRYRWMGVTPTLPARLVRADRPDVAHVYGFRDPVTTATAAWCRLRGIPYVFEPLGMFRARLRKVRLKRAFDRTLTAGVAAGAQAAVAVSPVEAADLAAGGVPRERIVVRGLGFPDPDRMPPPDGRLRRELGVAEDVPLAVYAGRIASGKGIDHLLAAARALPELRVALIGPDDRHTSLDGLRAELSGPALGGRVRLLPPTAAPPLAEIAEADVAVLASSGESFGLFAAEAAAAGTPVVVTDRCGVASFFREGEALVVPDERTAVVGAIARVVAEAPLRDRLSEGGRAAASRTTWDAVAALQERIYRAAAARTDATNLATLAS